MSLERPSQQDPPTSDADRANERPSRVSLTSKIDPDLRLQLKLKAWEGEWTMEEVVENLIAMWVRGLSNPVPALGRHEIQARDFSHLQGNRR